MCVWLACFLARMCFTPSTLCCPSDFVAQSLNSREELFTWTDRKSRSIVSLPITRTKAQRSSAFGCHSDVECMVCMVCMCACVRACVRAYVRVLLTLCHPACVVDAIGSLALASGLFNRFVLLRRCLCGCTVHRNGERGQQKRSRGR